MSNMDIFLAGIPYDMKMENDNNFHNTMFILLSLIGIRTETEVHTSDGRIDLVIKTDRFIYIIELKYDHSGDKALQQILDKNYAHTYLRDPRRVFLIGANFSSQTRHLDKPVIRELSADS